MRAQPDNALTALERARQAQERFERRIDVQLRLNSLPPLAEWVARCCGRDFPNYEEWLQHRRMGHS